MRPSILEVDATYLDDHELSRRLGFERNTLQKWRSLGSGPPWVKIGRAVRYHWPDVERWLSLRRVGGALHE